MKSGSSSPLQSLQSQKILTYFVRCAVLSAVAGNFRTKQVTEAAHIKARNLAQDALHDMIKDLARKTPRNSAIKWNTKSRPKYEPEKIMFEEDDLELIELDCCKNHVKIRAFDEAIGYYCPYCGSYQ